MSTLGAAQPWRIIVPPPANEAAMLQLLNELRGECAVLPVGSQVEHILSPDFDMLVVPVECVDCGVQLLRGELVYQRPLEGWIPIRVGRGVALRRPRAWLGGMVPDAAETVCGSCAAAELLPRYDGVAWVVLGEGDQGEIGRDVPDELAEQLVKDGKGVFFGARDVASMDVLIEVFGAARDRLAAAEGSVPAAEIVAALGADRAPGATLALRRACLILEEIANQAPAKSSHARGAEVGARLLGELLR